MNTEKTSTRSLINLVLLVSFLQATMTDVCLINEKKNMATLLLLASPLLPLSLHLLCLTFIGERLTKHRPVSLVWKYKLTVHHIVKWNVLIGLHKPRSLVPENVTVTKHQWSDSDHSPLLMQKENTHNKQNQSKTVLCLCFTTSTPPFQMSFPGVDFNLKIYFIS